MVNKRTAYFCYIRIVNIEENPSITPYVIPILRDRLQAGFVAEKDAGEPFWNAYHKGYDFYSAHLFLKDINWLKSLAIGDYKMSFGQGLVISNDFSPSRTAVVAQAERRTNGFRSTSQPMNRISSAGWLVRSRLKLGYKCFLFVPENGCGRRQLDVHLFKNGWTSSFTTGLGKEENDNDAGIWRKYPLCYISFSCRFNGSLLFIR